MILPHDPNASPMRLPDTDASSERRRSADPVDPPDPPMGSAVEWAPFDPGDAPGLPPTGDGSGRVVAVLAARELVRVGWAISVIVEMARSWAKERPGLVLVDTDLGRPRMHHALQVDNASGLAEILQGAKPVSLSTRVIVPDRLYFVPAGNVRAASEQAFDADRWARFCRAFAAAGVTVVAYVPDGAPWAPAVLDSATDVVELREQDTLLGTARPGETPVLAVLGPMPIQSTPIDPPADEPPAKAPLAPPPPTPPDERTAPGPTLAEKRRRGRRRSFVLTGLVLASIGAAASALLVIRGAGTGMDPESPAPVVGAEAGDAEGPPPADIRANPPGPHFSLAVASYTDSERARSRAAELASVAPEMLWYVAPVEIAGTVYQRVLGGLSPDSASGAALATRLADRLGADPEAWIIRRTDVVVDFGETTTLQGAEAEAARLRTLGVPAYVAEVGYSDRSIRWRVYAGGYAGVEEASHLADTATSLGLSAEIAPRLGAP